MDNHKVAVTCVFMISLSKEYTHKEIDDMVTEEVYSQMRLPIGDSFQVVEIEKIK